MPLSLGLACLWFVVAVAIALFPSKKNHWPAAYVLIAIGAPLLVWVFIENGFGSGSPCLRVRCRFCAGRLFISCGGFGVVSGVRRRMAELRTKYPELRGALTENRPLDGLTWLRVGGPADALVQPADVADLQAFLKALDNGIPVFPIGVGSNLIVRDGGIRAVVIRLGRGFNGIEIDGTRVRAGAAALDAHVARKAAEAGVDLTFLRTIPGAVGGAVRMNAGCYGSYVADVLIEVDVVLRSGELVTLKRDDLQLAYRSSVLPDEAVIVSALFEAPSGVPEDLTQRMEDQLAKRDATQPTKDRTAGSTFRNPAGFSSTGRADDTHEAKAWSLIDAAGLRGVVLGGAQMSPKHPNFLVNTGTATAADLESLGELVREKVLKDSGYSLEWEVIRVGEPATE